MNNNDKNGDNIMEAVLKKLIALENRVEHLEHEVESLTDMVNADDDDS